MISAGTNACSRSGGRDQTRTKRPEVPVGDLDPQNAATMAPAARYGPNGIAALPASADQQGDDGADALRDDRCAGGDPDRTAGRGNRAPDRSATPASRRPSPSPVTRARRRRGRPRRQGEPDDHADEVHRRAGQPRDDEIDGERDSEGYMTRFGMIRCSMSIRAITGINIRRAAIADGDPDALVDEEGARDKNAVESSSSGYRAEIREPQFRHRPRSSAQPRTGMLSRVANRRAAGGHRDRRRTTDSPAGTRAATTVMKLPIARPKNVAIATEPASQTVGTMQNPRC